MNDLINLVLVMGLASLVIGALFIVKGEAWVNYKVFYFKRQFWLNIGRCPKCRSKASITPKGRVICTKNGCR